MSQDAPPNRILQKMLERLFAAMANGPSLNCRPHSSRQRVDVANFAKLGDISPENLIRAILGERRQAKAVARIAPPRRKDDDEDAIPDDVPPTEEQLATRKARQAYSDQQALLTKLRGIAEDARTYEQDTGVHVLHIGYPLLSLPGAAVGGQRGANRRILAPLAFISINLSLRGGASPAVEIECHNDGADLVVPNAALLAWLEQQTGQTSADLFSDDEGQKPWKEIREIVRRICGLLEIDIPPMFVPPPPPPAAVEGQPAPPPPPLDEPPPDFALHPAPRADEGDTKPTIVSTAILGLFPMSNQGLLRDTQAMVAGEVAGGPIESFLRADVRLLEMSQPLETGDEPTPAPVKEKRDFSSERMIAGVDPCQARAVKLARSARGLVIHGPPGTGKSQTITNIIGDHLARGQRVLLVCDKRTALDVVMNRLQSLGLGDLCAVVHDPQRDQRELYRSIREQLENLPEAQAHPKAEQRLSQTDAELQRLHDELSAHHAALMQPFDGQPPFHELMGHWLALPATPTELPEAETDQLSVDAIDHHTQAIGDLLERGTASRYGENEWKDAAGLPLAELLATPMEQLRHAMAALEQQALATDATIDPAIPPFAMDADLQTQARRRSELIEPLKQIAAMAPAIPARWAERDLKSIAGARRKLSDLGALQNILQSGPLDAELALAIRQSPPNLTTINQQLAALGQYLPTARKWYAFACRKAKAVARPVHAAYGLPLNADNARRLATFLTALRARLLLAALNDELLQQPAAPGLPEDEALDRSLQQHGAVFDLLLRVHNEAELRCLLQPLQAALKDAQHLQSLIHGLERSTDRAAAIGKLLQAMQSSRFFHPDWLAERDATLRGGSPMQPTLASLQGKLDTLESVLRVRQGLADAPPELRGALTDLVMQNTESACGLTMLRRAALAMQIVGRLKTDPALQAVDGQRMRSSFQRYGELETQKRKLVRDAIQHQWVSRQKNRLLAQTGSRLNGDGADLRRRLTLRGERAMRLRQVIAVGHATKGGDPLFDLRPVWMASPETVAQIFPRTAMFDVVIFDEASQCRLEEALPVLTRGQRLVVAGDPKQLPPTRFFESAVAASEDEEIESDQQLFEHQQGEIEDLLAAALNIEIQEAYLDVHYRSRNADLIEFSNEHFYKSRLQAIPGHPSNRARYSPVTLYQVNGTYEKRANIAEADQVCRIVQDLLKRAQPPSIGIACFNLQQRDLIVEKLDDLAAEDAAFGKKLAEARQRRGPASFEGLFVKNLENVQGDERDYIIISTTYGPDSQGRFYRRFGPVGRAGGGRRLNVLVTRARQEVHVVTSIPVSSYAALPPVPAGEAPGGGWLLFAYLAYAKKLGEAYEQTRALDSEPAQAAPPQVNIRPSQTPSSFATALARQLAEQRRLGSDVHWGNDGFCIDVALYHPTRPEEVSIGVMCDLTRFAQAEDPVEWEVFRIGILESQGWELYRLWTPQFYRDPAAGMDAIVAQVTTATSTQEATDAIKVVPEDAQEPDKK